MNLNFTIFRLIVLLLLASPAFLSNAQVNKSKVSSDLINLAGNQVNRAAKAGQKQSTPKSNSTVEPVFEAIDNLQIINGSVVIDAISKNDPAVLMTELESIGLSHGSHFGGMVSGLLPIESIGLLAGVEPLSFVRPAYKPSLNTGAVTGQGDKAQLSDVARSSFDVNGSGIKVGIISDSWDNLGGQAGGIASGDLPIDIEILEELPSGGIDEGRAMGEIVYDVAPGTSLAFHTAFLGQADFANGILELAEAGSDVIVDDIIYLTEPMFQDGIIAQAADIVNDDGVSYFSSAGNNLDASYESPFDNGGTFDLIDVFSGDSLGLYELHDFDPGEGTDFFQEVVFGVGGGDITLAFQWNDSYASVCAGCPGAESDFDVFLALGDGDFSSIFADLSAMDDNIGNDPLELMGISTGGPVTAFIVIGKRKEVVLDSAVAEKGLMHSSKYSPRPHQSLIKYVNFGSVSITDYATASSTSFGHSNASGAISVGAVRYDATTEFRDELPTREVFSSSGGVPIFYDIEGNRLRRSKLRRKPEISAVQGANTTFFGFDYEGDGLPNFFGTSASAPYAAGVAALMLEAADSKVKPRDIKRAMQRSAVDMDDPRTAEFDEGFDFATGYGFLQADAAIATILKRPSVYRFELVDPIADTRVRTLRDGETIEINPDENEFFNIEALVGQGKYGVKSVKFRVEGDELYRALKTTERRAPYALFSDARGDFFNGSLPFGEYEMEVLAKNRKRRRGKDGRPNTITFSVDMLPVDSASSNARMIAVEESPETPNDQQELNEGLLVASELIAYPNPSSGSINFIWNDTSGDKAKLSVFDITGKVVEEFETSGGFEYAMDFSQYHSNIYFAKISTSKYTIVKRLSIIQ